MSIHKLVLLSISILFISPDFAIGAEAENENEITYELGLRHGIGWIYLGPTDVVAPYAAPNQELTLFTRHKPSMFGVAVDSFSLNQTKRSSGSDLLEDYSYGFEVKTLSGTSLSVTKDFNFFRKFYVGIGVGGFSGQIDHDEEFSNFVEGTNLVTVDTTTNVRGLRLDPNIRFQAMRGTIGIDIRINTPIYMIAKAPKGIDRTWVSYPLPTFALYWRF